jgi:hypothetical protein
MRSPRQIRADRDQRRIQKLFEPQDNYHGLTGIEFSRLATYNAEKSRGIMHTVDWQNKMAILQIQFDHYQHTERQTQS